MRLSVVIPAYNEEKRLPSTLENISNYLAQQSYDWEIIVVSDGSKDNTAKIGQEVAQRIPGIKVIDNKENHGKGWVVRQGLMEAQGEARLFTDADNSTPINQIEKFLPEIENGFDVVIGSRDLKGSEIAVAQPLYRRFLGDTFNFLVQSILGLWGIRDTQCGFKVLTARAANEILPKCKINRWAFDPEILVLAKKKKLKIKEVPVKWVNDPNSKVKFQGMVKMFFEVLQIRINAIKGNYR